MTDGILRRQLGMLLMNDPVAALRSLNDQRTVLLTSYKRDGSPVDTPVHIAVTDDHAFIRTYDKAWKYKRIRRNPEVEIAPSTIRGVPTGAARHAHARILDGEEARQAGKALASKYPILQGLLVPSFHKLRGYHTIHMELIPN